jgi:hypothetical protein
MQKYLRPILIGIAVTFVSAVLLGALLGADFTTIFFSAMFGCATAYILANLAGNRKVAAATTAERDAALRLKPPAGQALLVVYRVGYIAKLAGLNLALDGREFVQLTAPKFATLAVPPGPHILTAAFGGFAGAQGKTATCDLVGAPDGVVVIRITMPFGSAQAKLTPETDLNAARGTLGGMPMAVATPLS